MNQLQAVSGATPPLGHNRVELVGRIPAAPEIRTLPSGDEVVTFRLVVPRPVARRAGSRSSAAEASRPARSSVDVIDCSAWTSRLRRTVQRLPLDQPVRVDGVLHRRWWRSPGGSTSRCEVEVTAVSVC